MVSSKQVNLCTKVDITLAVILPALLFLGIDASDKADLTGHEEVVICETKGVAVQAEVLASDSEMFVEVESLPSRRISWTGIAAELFNLEPFAFAEREFRANNLTTTPKMSTDSVKYQCGYYCFQGEHLTYSWDSNGELLVPSACKEITKT